MKSMTIQPSFMGTDIQARARSVIDFNKNTISGMENPCKILCFGDSLTAGYTPLFVHKFNKEFPGIKADIINAGIGGETSRDALKRLTGLLEEKPTIVVVGFGMNDMAKAISQQEFTDNISKIVDAFVQTNARVLLLTLNPIYTFPDDKNALIDQFNLIIKEVAYQKHIRIIDINSLWRQEIKPWYKGLHDAVHPNELGYQIYCKAILRIISRRSIIILWQYNGNPCKCNYACPYCTYNSKTQEGHYFSGKIEDWHDAFKKTFGNQHLVFYFGHGEPMVGDKWLDVVAMIGSEPNWEMRVISNISVSLTKLLQSRVSQEGRLNINASFHPSMTTIERFLKKLYECRQYGIEVPIVYTMWPPYFKRFKNDFGIFNEHHFLIHLRRFQGIFRGKRYPQGYTDEERQFMAKYMDDAMIKYMLSWEPSYGKLTWTGVDFIILDNKGNAGYCDDFRPNKYSLGNIFDNSLRLLSEPHPFPGRDVSDGTADGVANFLELNYQQLTENHVLSFARQGGVYHTPNGVYYKNMHTDFNNPRIRAEYNFPPRNITDCYFIIAHGNSNYFSRLKKIFQFIVPEKLKSSLLMAFPYTRKIISTISLIILHCLCFLYACMRGLPGIKIHIFGWKYALSLLYARDWTGFKRMFLNPIPLLRYMEFSFTLRSVNWENVNRVLDISSPRLLTAYLLTTQPTLKMSIINPDNQDIIATRDLFAKCYLNKPLDISCLYPNDITEEEAYDVIYSLSVMEHVLEENETTFLLKIWSMLKPGGTLLITVPVNAKYLEEYRKEDTYGLGYPHNDEKKIFFQRCYDDHSLKQRIFNVLQTMPHTMEIFGFKKGWKFHSYIERCKTLGLKEVAKDSYYASKYIRRFDRVSELPERGICCMSFIKFN
ncbi:MAG: GDSL-type esterase/lipase family protein [bacterium]